MRSLKQPGDIGKDNLAMVDLGYTKHRRNRGKGIVGDFGFGGADDTAEAKKRIMRENGIHVVDSPAEIGKKVKEVLG